jgi:type II secretory pathway pseudopilin PulG
MKKLRYTLIELLVAMGIFIIMMGILFSTFSAVTDVSTNESVKVGILADANVFFGYITQDIREMNVEIIPAPESEGNSGGSKTDPEDNTNAVTDYGDSKLTYTSTSLEFFSEVDPYEAMATSPPYIKYTIEAASGGYSKIYRSMWDYDPATKTFDNEQKGLILEGVKTFDIKVWDDYPGGTELTESPVSSKPACITISITLTNPNPNMTTTLRERAERTVTKTVFLTK